VVDLGIELPAGHTLVSLEERPDLIRPSGRFNGSVWPTFMLQDAQADSHWHHFDEDFPEFQLVLLDAAGEIAATNNSAPIAWDGTDGGLPEGWDDQVERTVRNLLDSTPVDTLGAIQIVVDPARRGSRLGGVMVQAMQANALRHGFRALIACVRRRTAIRSSRSSDTPSGPAPTACRSTPGSGCTCGSGPASSADHRGP
jgi:GNAT superfamily N-acetyltransferase